MRFLRGFSLLLTACVAILGGVTSGMAYHLKIGDENASARFSTYCMGYGTIKGIFGRITGFVNIHKTKPEKSKISISIDTKSLRTNNHAFDTYLRSSTILSVNKFPKAVFESTAVKADSNNTVTVKGRLTLRGITREMTIVSIVVSDPKNHTRAFTGTMSFRLSDFGMDTLIDLFVTRVNVTMRIEETRR
jgi:polyisoprenoid-binding protein YceI